MPRDFIASLSENIRTLRHTSGLSQARLAERAGIPRATLSLLESGEGNPTLTVVLSVCEALGVRLDEVLSAPPSDTVVHRAKARVSKKRGRCVVKKLLPQNLEGLELEELVIPAGQTLVGVPHTIGTREYLLVQTGTIHLHLAGEMHIVGPGDVAVFRGHQKHSYRNPCGDSATALSVIAFATTGPVTRD